MNSRLDDLLGDSIEEIPIEKIPAALAQLAAASQQLASRMMTADTSSAVAAEDHGLLLDVKEASTRMRKSTTWLYRNAGTLPFTVRVGRSLRFSESGLQRWIKGRSGR